jgi:hypothetical protein
MKSWIIMINCLHNLLQSQRNAPIERADRVGLAPLTTVEVACVLTVLAVGPIRCHLTQ